MAGTLQLVIQERDQVGHVPAGQFGPFETGFLHLFDHLGAVRPHCGRHMSGGEPAVVLDRAITRLSVSVTGLTALLEEKAPAFDRVALFLESSAEINVGNQITHLIGGEGFPPDTYVGGLAMPLRCVIPHGRREAGDGVELTM